MAELSDREAVKGLIPAIVNDGETVDILLNCAGIQRRHPSAQFPDGDWDDVCSFPILCSYVRDRAQKWKSSETDLRENVSGRFCK